MAKEIERKYLIKNMAWGEMGMEGVYLEQGYLSHDPEKTIRVRIDHTNYEAFMTIKGKTEGISRDEIEFEIPASKAKELLQFCSDSIVRKERYKKKVYNPIAKEYDVWEVDYFWGDNEGLILAEIEIPFEDYMFTPPDWVGEEVTTDWKYSNSNLSKKPYKSWN